MDANHQLLSMPQAGKRLGRSAAWVKARCDDGSLRHWLIRGRRWTTAAAIAEYLDRCEGHGRAPPLPTHRAGRAHAEAVAELGRMGLM